MKREYLLLALIAIGGCLFYSWGINNWRFSFVGDEWAFFDFAKGIVAQHFRVNPFGMRGVYGELRVMESIPQAIFIGLFGPSNIAWRFANTFLAIPCALALYALLRLLFPGSKVSLYGAVLLASSATMANYFKIGYTIPYALFWFLIVLWSAAAMARYPQKTRYFVFLGLSLGISFYHYIGPVFPVLAGVFLIASVERWKRPSRSLVRNLGIGIAIYAAVVLLSFIGSGFSDWQGAMRKTVLRPEFSSYWQIPTNVLRCFLVFFKNFDYANNHFVIGPYVDLLSRFLVLGGAGVLVFRLKNVSYRALGLTFAATCMLFGLTIPYPYIPINRSIFFVPFACMFGAIGLEYLAEKVHRGFIIALLAVVLGLNVYQSQVRVFEERGYNRISAMFGELLSRQKSRAKKDMLVFVKDVPPIDENRMRSIADAYGWSTKELHFATDVEALCKFDPARHDAYFVSDKKRFDQVRAASPCADPFNWAPIVGYF